MHYDLLGILIFSPDFTIKKWENVGYPSATFAGSTFYH